MHDPPSETPSLASQRWVATLLATIPSAAALLLYVAELAPTVHWSDTAELQRTVATLDLPHPTGYPLYLLVGKLWVSIVPWSDVAWRVNLLSAVLGSVAVALVTLLVWRISRNAVAALTAGFVLASAPSFWSQAIVAEVYTLHAVLLPALFLAVLAPRPRPWLIALLVGLGLAHHRMTVLVLPGVAWAAVVRCRPMRPSRRDAWLTLAALAVGLSPYLLTLTQIGWRDPAGFVAHVFHTGETWWSVADVVPYVFDVLWPIARQQLDAAGFALALFGLVWFVVRGRSDERVAGAMVALSWVLSIVFFALYRVPDAHALATHFLVLHAVAIGLGIAAIVACVLPRLPERGRSAAPAAIAALVGIGLIAQAPGAHAAVAKTEAEWTYPRDRALSILRDTGGGAVLAADYLLGQTILYLQDVEGLRPDVHTVIHDRDPDWARSLLDQDRPVYLWGTGWREALAADSTVRLIPAEHDRFEEGLFRLVPSDTLRVVWELPRDTAQSTVRLTRLEAWWPWSPHEAPPLGYATVMPWPLIADAPAKIVICWQSWPRPDWGEVVGLRWSMDFDAAWFTHDFGGLGVPDADACTHHFFVVPPAPAYPTSSAILTLYSRDGSADPAVPAPIRVPVRASHDIAAAGRTRFTLPAPHAFAVAGLRLDGVQHAPSVRPGMGLTLESAWWWDGEHASDAVEWQLVDTMGEVVDRAGLQLAPFERPPGTLDPYLIGTSQVLTVPRRVRPGVYGIRAAQPGSGSSPLVSTVVGTSVSTLVSTLVSTVTIDDWVRLSSPPAMQRPLDVSMADGTIGLLGADVAHDGRRVLVTLYWKAEQETDRDWKVFVHVVDGQGNLTAQADGFPGDGVRWTDGWREGEIVVDPHAVELPDDTHPDSLRLLVGMYDPVTGARASAHRSDGSAWPDFAVDLGEIGPDRDVLESSP